VFVFVFVFGVECFGLVRNKKGKKKQTGEINNKKKEKKKSKKETMTDSQTRADDVF
jgi:hypothetical protein